MLPTAETLYEVIEKTWPAAGIETVGPWTIRNGNGGGKRVSAATAEHKIEPSDVRPAEVAMKKLGQPALFQIRDNDQELDHILNDEGYQIIDPVVLYAAPIEPMAENLPDRLSGIASFPPLAISCEIWESGGIGSGRIAVMERADCIKTTLLGRVNDHTAGVLYLGIDQGCAMVHAVEVAEGFRRQGVAAKLMAHAARWAADRGAKFMTLVTTTDNTGSNRLYQNLNMARVGNYHYRIKQDQTKEIPR